MRAVFIAALLLGAGESRLHHLRATTTTPLVKKTLAVRGGFGPNVRNPKETFQAYASFGAVQGTMETAPMILQSLLAGAYIAFGAVLAMSVGAAIPGIKASDPGIQKVRGLPPLQLPGAPTCVLPLTHLIYVPYHHHP